MDRFDSVSVLVPNTTFLAALAQSVSTLLHLKSKIRISVQVRDLVFHLLVYLIRWMIHTTPADESAVSVVPSLAILDRQSDGRR